MSTSHICNPQLAKRMPVPRICRRVHAFRNLPMYTSGIHNRHLVARDRSGPSGGGAAGRRRPRLREVDLLDVRAQVPPRRKSSGNPFLGARVKPRMDAAASFSQGILSKATAGMPANMACISAKDTGASLTPRSAMACKCTISACVHATAMTLKSGSSSSYHDDNMSHARSRRRRMSFLFITTVLHLAFTP